MAVFANARCCSITFSRLMMMLLIFVLCCSVFQVFVVAVLVLSRGNFLVFISNENEMTMMSSKGKIFDASCLSKMMILLIFVLCVSGFRRGCAGVIERRRFHFFFCRSSPSLCSLATSRRYLHTSVSLVHVHSGCYLTRHGSRIYKHSGFWCSGYERRSMRDFLRRPIFTV